MSDMQIRYELIELKKQIKELQDIVLALANKIHELSDVKLED